jgi:hypothetical protein
MQKSKLDLDGLVIGGDDKALTHASLVNNLGSVRENLTCI